MKRSNHKKMRGKGFMDFINSVGNFFTSHPILSTVGKIAGSLGVPYAGLAGTAAGALGLGRRRRVGRGAGVIGGSRAPIGYGRHRRYKR